MATRPTATQTRTARAAAVQPEVINMESTDTHGADTSAFTSWFDAWMADMKATWTRRRIVATVLGCIAAYGMGYLGGQLTFMLAFATLMATTSMFLAAVVFAIGVVLSLKAGAAVGKLVAGFAMSDDAEAMYQGTKRKVAGWFGSCRSALSF